MSAKILPLHRLSEAEAKRPAIRDNKVLTTTSTGIVIGGAYQRPADIGSEAERIQTALLKRQRSHILGGSFPGLRIKSSKPIPTRPGLWQRLVSFLTIRRT